MQLGVAIVRWSYGGKGNKTCGVVWEEVLENEKGRKTMRSNIIRQGSPLCPAYIGEFYEFFDF